MSPRQQARAKKARETFQALGSPHIDDFKAMIRMNLIKNNKVTMADVNLAEKAHGPDIGSLKGKSTLTRPVPVVDNLIEIPDELLEVQRNVTLSMDGMMVNSLKFLTTILHDVFYRTAQFMRSTVASEYEDCLNDIKDVYN